MLASLLKERKTAKVLDLGRGTGRHTVYLASLGFDVYGFDWSDASIGIASSELTKEGLHATLLVWDMNETPLPYRDSFFDCVLSIRAFHHTLLEKIRLIVSEIQRITKAGGLIYVEVPSWHEDEKILNSDIVEIEPRTLIWSKGKEANVPHHHFLREELLEFFEGCAVQELNEKSGHYCLLLMRK